MKKMLSVKGTQAIGSKMCTVVAILQLIHIEQTGKWHRYY